MDNSPENPKTVAPVLYKFTNQKNSEELDTLLAMFYQGVYNNAIGIMQALNLNTGKEDIILVGIQLDENGKPDCFPIAKGLRIEDVRDYQAPDGQGGFYDPLDPMETAKAKEHMKTFAEAAVDAVPEEVLH